MKQRIKEESMTVDVIERMKLIEVAEQEVHRRECELEAKVKRLAQAEKGRLEVISGANHQRALTEAAGQAEAIAMRGDAEVLWKTSIAVSQKFGTIIRKAVKARRNAKCHSEIFCPPSPIFLKKNKKFLKNAATFFQKN